MVYIDLRDVCLTFQVRGHARITFKDYLLRTLLRRPTESLHTVRALRHVNLTVREGDRVGVIGPNGAGKSSLLKLLAGVYPPTGGRRRVRGRISSLFDIAVGFEPEATGWDNIAYRCYLQGETPADVRAKQADIAEFSELGKFLDIPVRYYSAGMRVRLAFAIATAIDPEVLLVDEVLGVGDLAFQNKARQRMHEMINRARLMVMVSHDLASLARVCNRLIWLEQGQVRQEGNPAELIAAYTTEVQGAPAPVPAAA